MGKYQQFDKKIFAWLESNPEDITTSKVVAALEASTKAHIRHISRRFSQLEDRGVLECRLRGTTRICMLVDKLPATLAKPKRSQPARVVVVAPVAIDSIPATDSIEFEQAGGRIDRIPPTWNQPTSNSMGINTFDDYLDSLD